MPAHNDVTGDAIKSRASSEEYRDNWDRIFAKKYKKQTAEENLQAAINMKKGVKDDMVLDLEPMQPATPEAMKSVFG